MSTIIFVGIVAIIAAGIVAPLAIDGPGAFKSFRGFLIVSVVFTLTLAAMALLFAVLAHFFWSWYLS